MARPDWPLTWAALRELRRAVPVAHPVHVRTCELAGVWGDCWLRRRRRRWCFMVRLDRRQPDELAVQTLVHEYAHLAAWYSADPTDHGDAWALAYGRCYRLVLEP